MKVKGLILRSTIMALCIGVAVVSLAPSVKAQDESPAVLGAGVEEVRQLIASHAVSELRTTYNGSYGASLLFAGDTLTYYAVLFKGKDFWRVLKTEKVDEAERVYRAFVVQTEQLAQPDLATVRLEAGKKYAAELISKNESRLQSLQGEMAREQQQAGQVAAAQRQAQQAAAALNNDLDRANQRLESIRDAIQQLEAKQASPLVTLPAPAPPAPPKKSTKK